MLFVIAIIFCNQFKCNYLWNKKTFLNFCCISETYIKFRTLFLNFLLHFWNLHQTLNILKNKMTFIAYVFSKLRTVKDAVRQMSKKNHFRTLLSSQHAKVCQTLLKSAQQHFYQIFQSFCQKFSWKMFLLVISEILGLLVNTLTVDNKYSLSNSENLPQPIQMQLSKN